jgi:uncharacterized surface anchored protein
MTPKQINDRFERGLAMLNDPTYTVEKFDTSDTSFYVTNANGDTYLTMVKTWRCNCFDFQRNRQACKHLFACEEILNQENQIEQAILAGHIEEWDR